MSKIIGIEIVELEPLGTSGYRYALHITWDNDFHLQISMRDKTTREFKETLLSAVTHINRLERNGDLNVTKRKAPWLDRYGNELFEGDIIKHPSGQQGEIVFFDNCSDESDQWRVNYGCDDISRLCLQINEKGQAVKVT